MARRFTEDELHAALRALNEPGRFEEAERRVAAVAPELQHILIQALHEGGWFESAHEQQLKQAAGVEDVEERLRLVRSILAEETRIGMWVGVAVGWELHRALELEPGGGGDHAEGS